MDGIIMYPNQGLIFDTETHKLHGDIIEAGALDFTFENGELKIGYEHDLGRFKPSEPISLGAMAVHHILDEDLKDCKPFTDFKIPVRLNTRYLIGHNIDYDVQAMNRTGFDFNAQLIQPFEAICTLAMARRLWPQLESHSLTALAYHVSENKRQTRICLKEAHSAINDCYTTFEILKAIVITAGLNDMEDLAAFSYNSRTPTHIFYGEYKGYAISDLPDQALDDLKENSEGFLLSSLRAESFRRSELPF